MSVKVVNSGSGVINITAETIPTIKVSSPTVSVVDINPVVTGSTIGPTGAQGPAGSDGQGLEAGGDKHQVLKKIDDVDYNTEWGFADRVFISVKFDEAVSAGDPVYVSGYQSGQDVVKVSKADSSDSAKMPAIGLAIEDYSLNAFGSVACIGSLYGIDTDDFNVGDVLYVKSGGGLTKDKPTGATNLIQNVGKVGRSQQNTGEIVVMAIGRSNDVPNIADGKIWIGNGSGVATPTTLNAAAIPDFDTEVSNNSSVAANTAKETNVTTDLGLTQSSVNVTVTSSDGTNATIPQVSTTLAGVMTAAEHVKLARINASADVTNSSSVEAAGAIMDTDFTSNGLMERTGNGSYDVVAKNTDNISEGSNNLYYTDARADARVSAVIDTDNTLADPSDTVVPSQAAIKTYVDNQLGTQSLQLGTRTATQLDINITGGGTSVTIPAANTTEAGLMTEAQFDKLAGIEAGADATDATNVAAAGAVMNIGNESIDGVKTFTSTISGSINGNAATVTNGVYTTSSVTALSDVSDAGSGIIMSTAERTKLTGIEANATADQTAAEIRTLVDAASDSNVFTDADHDKLNAIEASADVTDATNVAAAGALMTTGGQMTGSITFSGSQTVDNRDLSVDGAKLDTIEPNATADQTDAEIRAAVEAANDSNVFTDADHSKLNGIEANATADQTAAEIRTLVEAATDSNVFTDADHSKLNGIEANATADQTDAEIRAAVEAATDSNVFTDADHTKLDNIAANATNYGDSDVNDHLSGGTGIGYNNGVISVTGTTTFSTADSGSTAVKAVINGPDGNTDDLIFTQGSNVTLTQANGNITIAATSGGIDNVEDDTSPSLGGNLNVNDFHIVSDASEHITIEAGSGGDVNIDGEPVNIKHANTTRLATSGTGVTVTGHLDMADDDEIRLGTDNDFRIKYDSANDDGELRAASIALKGSNDEFMLLAQENGVVSLYYDNARKFDTTSYGVSVSGHAAALGYTTSLSTSLSAVGNHRGATLIEGVYTNGSVTIGKVYYMGSTAWAEGHADTEASAKGMLAVATSAAANGRFVTRGLVKVLDIKGSNPSKGDIVYLSEASGESGYVTVDRPAADGDIVRIVGYVVDNSNDTIYFDPSPDFIEVA